MTITVNLKEKLVRKINKISKETKKDTSYYLNKAMENYLAEQEELNEALIRLNDKKDKVISSSEFKKSLGI